MTDDCPGCLLDEAFALLERYDDLLNGFVALNGTTLDTHNLDDLRIAVEDLRRRCRE